MINTAAYCRTCGAVWATCSRYWSPRRRMMSRNRTLRCPASTMYSTAEATSPDIGLPDIAALSIGMCDLFLPQSIEVRSHLAGLDLGQARLGQSKGPLHGLGAKHAFHR